MNFNRRKQSSWHFIYYVSPEGNTVSYELDSLGCHKKKFKKLSKRPIHEIYSNNLTEESSSSKSLQFKQTPSSAVSNNNQFPSQNISFHENNKDENKKDSEVDKNQVNQSNDNNHIFVIPNINGYKMNQKENEQHKTTKENNKTEGVNNLNFTHAQVDFDDEVNSFYQLFQDYENSK